MQSNTGAITNDVLDVKLGNLSVQVGRLELTINRQADTYVSHDVFELRMKEIDLRIKEIEASLARTASSRWIQNTLAAILGAVISLLVAFYFTHNGG